MLPSRRLTYGDRGWRKCPPIPIASEILTVLGVPNKSEANSRRIDDEDLSELMSKEPQQRDWHPTFFWLVAMALVIALVAAVVGFAIAAEGIWDRLD